MLSSVPEVPLATCTGAVSPVVTAVPRAGGHAEQAWPVPGWVRHGPGWVRHRPGWIVSGLGQARAELGTAGLTWKGPCRSCAELAGDRNGLSMGHAMEGGHRPGHHGRAAAGPGRPTPWPSRERTGQIERFVPERTDGASQAMAPTTQGEPTASRKAPDSPRREWQIQRPGQARQWARAMPVASRTDTGSGSAAAESSSRYPGARRSGGRPASNSPDRRNCAAVASADTLISLATRVTNRWPASQRGYKDRLRELPEGRGHHAAGLGG